MRFRAFMRAAFKRRNIVYLLLMLLAANIFNFALRRVSPAYPRAITTFGDVEMLTVGAFYLIFVVQTLASKKFQEECRHKERIRQIQDLNYTCLKLSGEAKKYTNTVEQLKLRKVMEDKNELVRYFFVTAENNYIKLRITENALNLVKSYLKLLINYCIRNRQAAISKTDDIVERVNSNTKRLSLSKDLFEGAELRNVIAMDRKILGQLREEKKELERMGIKLDYLERNINMLKLQIFSDAESEEMLADMQKIMDEATAFNNVLEFRKKERTLKRSF